MAGLSRHDHGAVGVLMPENGGRYPYGNSLLIRGSGETVLVDPSLAVGEQGPAGIEGGERVDAIVVSHGHEDHLAGVHRYPDVPVYAHDADLAAVRSVDTLVEGYGLPADRTGEFRAELVRDFGLVDRPDATGLADGTRLDLGDRTVTVVHLPGHTAGHCGLLIEPDDFFFVGDIDLSRFGPYYGDTGSDLEAFEASIERCLQVQARWYGTFHHKGVVTGAQQFAEQLRAYRDVIGTREQRLLEFLGEPRTLDEVVAHRIVYRPHVDLPWADTVERRTSEQHLARLVADGTCEIVEPGRFRRAR
ncbi:Metallo-beta-lactamase superfamily protein [Pseudonocardia ammonioxydans]|uniref:Metallo-beta-lactamase superfamily protein n=1 Tax=Pseudonocardia ammonioxydans TaxID=260086 RepID=A0A1I5AQA0_PSUAM|nr:MBL fold metallo-hydrolase [Pseudonocardia ammonioxydans]SFN64560.1 Metallo-beta-lactamase superfamily protein [Pseudonocardia ammonioxydans]